MPSKNMLPKGHRRRSVRAEYRATRGVEAEPEAPAPVLDLHLDTEHDTEPAGCVRMIATGAAWMLTSPRRFPTSAEPECSC
jgi:23S rRNA pseudouridine1911/1915/1917 synthase